jgi:hypothetical protein
MLNKLKPKSEFNRNVLTLMTGTTVATSGYLNNDERRYVCENV